MKSEDKFMREFLEERGIDPDGEVARARQYTPYAAGDVDAVYDAMDRIAPGLMSNDGGRRNEGWVGKFTQSEGFVIPKYTVFDGLHPIRPQLRPKGKVVERTWRHNHSDNAVDAEGRRMSKFALDQHRKSKNRAEAGEHKGIGLKRDHEHKDYAKYGIAPEVRDAWVEVEGSDAKLRSIYNPATKTRHYESPSNLRQLKSGKVKRRWRFADYLGLASFDDSQRLDRNPLSDFGDPGPVYLGIEGTPKNDAMVEWLRKRDRPAKVVNVPGVSMWKAPELAKFALSYMCGQLNVVVADADWIENDEVIYHAENCALYLSQRCGVQVVIAAPPQDAGHKGVDDFLRSGGSMDDLDVIRRDFDPDALDDWTDEYRSIHRSKGRKPKTLGFDLHLARVLGRTAGRHGRTLRNIDALARLGPSSGIITENEAAAISRGPELPGDADYAEKERQKVLRSLERLDGIAYESTGDFHDWVSAHVEIVGWKNGKPQRVKTKGGPGSRIEFLSVDERLRMKVAEPEPLGDVLAWAAVPLG